MKKNRPDRPVSPHKAALLDHAIKGGDVKSFVDLGGCWGVNGGYAFHLYKQLPSVEKAYILDLDVTELTIERAPQYSNLEIINTMLGSQSATESVGKVDLTIMYDILLHQVNPDWKGFLRMWAKQTQKHIVIYNQNWARPGKTVRFIENGLDWYCKNVPYPNYKAVVDWFSSHDDYNEEQGVLTKDIYNFWQWGIKQFDLISVLEEEGFELTYLKRYGAFDKDKPWVVNDGMIFSKPAF